MDDKTISRVEEKYLISPSEKSALLAEIETKYLERDRFYEEEVLSIYFDTPDFRIANRSMERPPFRFKLRIRSYNTPGKNSPVFFEIKSKYATRLEHLGNKRRLVLFLSDLNKYLAGKAGLEPLAEKYSLAYATHDPAATIPVAPFCQTQFARELDYIMRLYSPSPRVLVSANRFAFSARNDPSFRLTFDHALRYRTANLRLDKGSKGTPFFSDDSIIMEVKTLESMPLWFVSELSRLHITPARFSKYGKIFQHLAETEHFNHLYSPPPAQSSQQQPPQTARKKRKKQSQKERITTNV